MRVLLVEDDPVLGSAIRSHIADQGHGVDWVTRLDDAEEVCATTEYGVILLDLGLPDGRGLDFLKALRARKIVTPVIITTAQDQITVRIEGLNSGADDYLIKPFDLNELSARLSAVARRYSGSTETATQIGDIAIDLGRRHVTRGGQDVLLTAREWAVMDCLVRNKGAVVSKSRIEDSLYAFGAEIESNAVEVFVSRLRKKLGSDLISTQRGLGYSVGTK
jgi:DNA-binding response OmpR family regulator